MKLRLFDADNKDTTALPKIVSAIMTPKLAKTMIKVTGALKDSFQFVHGMFILSPFLFGIVGNWELVTGVIWI
mgnify:CR=1 FL=1